MEEMRTLWMESRSGKQYNEDACGWGKDFWFVIDGASGLKPESAPVPSAARLAAGLKELFEKRLDEPLPLETIVSQCLADLSSQFALGEDPSAALAILRKIPSQMRDALPPESEYEYFILADCSICAKCENGEVITLCDERIARFDGKVLELMETEAAACGIPFVQARSLKSVSSLIVSNRGWKNRPGGYASADLSGKGVSMALTGTLPALQAALLYSDGFAILQEFLAMDADTFFDYVFSDPKQAVDVLESYCEGDGECEQLHRLKKKDDITLLAIGG